ncbi:MAG: hypothetical protein RSD78_05245, partial [Oscillospiraceae bacterium]
GYLTYCSINNVQGTDLKHEIGTLHALYTCFIKKLILCACYRTRTIKTVLFWIKLLQLNLLFKA